MAGSGTDRRSYDTEASAQAQAGIQAVIARLEEVMAQREAQVREAMAEFTADGVAEEYHGRELRWSRASQEVRNIIALVRATLEDDDATARSTMAKAGAAVDGIG
ncbi:pore-forming ESAT-6 family protein [Streptomyces sp. NPDC048664]|uniref:pore-forming ESAT-6 family protein n=1 Tax=Streptomyces sp. NPDC048664 TaxID=3154505 RepID=UPI0034483601